MAELSAEYLRERFNYCSETGILTWRTSRGTRSRVGAVVGSVGNHGYLVVNLEGQPRLLHRLIWTMVHGAEPKEEIDHANHARTDNRLCNLREATRQQNLANKRVRRDSQIGVKGVRWDAESQMWRASITAGGKTKWLGRRKDPEEAGRLYAEAAKELFGEYAHF